jgi:hypothetical protein
LTVFVDRNLGRYAVPEALRTEGLEVHTMLSVYGDDAEETVADVEWMRLCGEQEWLVLSKDDRIRYRARELAIVKAHNVRIFVVTKAGLAAEQQLARIIPNLNRMALRARRRGPWIDGLYEGTIRRLWPETNRT